MKTYILLILVLLPRLAQALDFPFSLQNFGALPHSRMHTVLEKTILGVDVLHLQIYFSDATAKSFTGILAQKTTDPDWEKKIADEAGHAEEAYASIKFLRSVSLAQFLQGIQDNLVMAKNAGYISQNNYVLISQGLPKWYAFLEERGIRKGDAMYYRIHHDELRVVYISVDGQTLLDQKDFGPERRLSVLGSYFALGSDFREGLIDSLLP